MRAGVDMTGGGGASASDHGRELLPANVVPRHYHLTLEPDFDKLSFDGSVVIDLDVAQDSSFISLNTLELDIHSASVSCNGQALGYVPMSPFRSPRLTSNPAPPPASPETRRRRSPSLTLMAP